MTIQTEIIAAMAHRSGAVPWLRSEIAQRMGCGQTNNTIGNLMQALQSADLVEPIPMPTNGGAVAWQLTPQGVAAAATLPRKAGAIKEKPRCGGEADIVKIMAEDKSTAPIWERYQDAYRLSIMDTDPAYHSGNRLPGAMELQQAHAEVRRAKARAKVLNGIRQGDLSTRACQMFAGISYSAARKAVEELAYAGLIEALPQTHLGIAYRITDAGRKCP